MTNKEIMDIAMQQSAYDTNAKVSDFLQDTNVFVKSGVGPLARKYYKEPIACNFVSYGSNVVASVKDEFKEIVETYLSKFEFYHCFETPNMHWLDERMKEKGYRVCFMAEYFLPDMERLKRLECNYVLKVLEQKDFADLYLPMWGNALCADRKELDVLGVGAYDGEKLVGLAACSADCDNMWQIGVDVLPEYRRMGIASSLTSNLAIEIIERGKVPFYCCAWSNLKSVKNALRSGFVPGWVEMTVKAAKERLKLCYMVMQDVNHQLFTESVLDEILLSMRTEDKQRAREILQEMDLLPYEDCHPMGLSGGQKQRVAVASAMASERPLILFDEPTSGLDLFHMRQVANVVNQVANTGRTALVVTHDPEFILRCCNYVLHLENGQIQESYSIEDSDGRKRLLKFFLSDMKKEVSTE